MPSASPASNPRAFERRLFAPEHAYRYPTSHRALRNTTVRVSEWFPTFIRAGLDANGQPVHQVRWEGWVVELGRLVPECDLIPIPTKKKPTHD